uniref:Uncharacterized protein n=1 Tax=Sphaerodactylus townsendi TaxID=933632 RepID=A0ACB8E602_9SAUR
MRPRGTPPISAARLSLAFPQELDIAAAAFGAAASPVLLESIMCPLLSFLKNCLRTSRCVHPFQHPCLWLSELFIEQDDDMFEASKALLSVHSHLRRFWLEDAFPSCLSDDQTQGTLTHRNGCNPHCVFLFLLQSVAFDPTVLLDFLISSETCFLEYLVRYLKLLVEDWPRFACVSEGFEPMASGVHSFSLKGPSNQEKNGCQLHAHAERTLCDPQYCTVPFLTSSQSYSVVLQFDNRVVKPNRSGCLRGSDNMSSLGSVPRLVDYESSEDSDGEEECLADRPQTLLNNQACSDTAILEHDASPPDDDLTVLPPSWHQGSPNEPTLAEGTLWKSVKCLQELHKSISRLHRRNLFPYNPAALLKLLTRIDIISGAGRSAPSPPSLECLVSLAP